MWFFLNVQLNEEEIDKFIKKKMGMDEDIPVT